MALILMRASASTRRLREPHTEGACELLLPGQAGRGRVGQRLQLALAWRRRQPCVSAPCPQVVCEKQAEEEEEQLSEADHDPEEAPGEQHGHHMGFEGPPDDGDASPDVDPLVHRLRLQGSACLPATVCIAEQRESCLLTDVDYNGMGKGT